MASTVVKGLRRLETCSDCRSVYLLVLPSTTHICAQTHTHTHCAHTHTHMHTDFCTHLCVMDYTYHLRFDFRMVGCKEEVECYRGLCICVCVFVHVMNKLSFPRLSCVMTTSAGPERPKRSWPYRYLVHSVWHPWY